MVREEYIEDEVPPEDIPDLDELATGNLDDKIFRTITKVRKLEGEVQRTVTEVYQMENATVEVSIIDTENTLYGDSIGFNAFANVLFPDQDYANKPYSDLVAEIYDKYHRALSFNSEEDAQLTNKFAEEQFEGIPDEADKSPFDEFLGGFEQASESLDVIFKILDECTIAEKKLLLKGVYADLSDEETFKIEGIPDMNQSEDERDYVNLITDRLKEKIRYEFNEIESQSIAKRTLNIQMVVNSNIRIQPANFDNTTLYEIRDVFIKFAGNIEKIVRSEGGEVISIENLLATAVDELFNHFEDDEDAPERDSMQHYILSENDIAITIGTDDLYVSFNGPQITCDFKLHSE